MADHDYARAALQFQNAVQAMPNRAEAYYQLALACLQSNQGSRAAAALEKAANLNPNDSRVQVKLAELMVATRDVDLAKDAESRIRKVLLTNPSDLDALFVLAATEVQLGRPEEAEMYLREVLDRSPKDLRTSVAIAQMKLSRKDFAGAEAALKAAARQAPDLPQAAAALGAFYAGTGNLPEAEHWLRQALRQDPQNAAALVRLGALELKAGRKEEAEATYKQIAALPQTEFKAAYATFLMQQKRADAAVTEFERLARVDPNDRMARTRLVAAYAAINRWGDAEAILSRALTKNEKDLDALLQRVQIHLRNARFNEAQKDAEAIIRYEPGSAEAHYFLAIVHKSRNAGLLTKNELGEALRLDPSLLPARIEMANALLDSNSVKAAFGILDEAPERQKNTAAWGIAHNWALLADGDLAEARKGVDRLLSAGRSTDALTQDGVVKLTSHDTTGARTVFEEVLKDNPGDVRVLGLLAQSYSLHNEQSAGTVKLRLYTARAPRSSPVQMLWATWLLATGNTAEARRALAAARTADPGNAGADQMLARLDFQEGKVEEAQRTLNALLAADPRNLPAQLMLGTIQTQMNRPTEAIDHFRKALEVDNASVAALNNLAFLLARDLAQVDRALAYAQKAKELAPQDSYVQDTLGWVYFRKGRYALAARELESALNRAARPSIKFHLGVTYLKMGNSKGRDLMAAALQADPKLAETEVWQ